MTRLVPRNTYRFLKQTIALFLSLAFAVALPWNVATADVKVAFVADQGRDRHMRAVLKLIKRENVDLLLIQGDFGYGRKGAASWKRHMEKILGANFPILGVVGNHENFQWPIYKAMLANRIALVDDLKCTGDVGVKSHCQFRGLDIVQVSPGISEVNGVKPNDNYAEYITEKLTDSPSHWRICSWHKNQHTMQLGEKGDETGWDVYQACLKLGAIVATGHEHSYSRTYLLSDFEKQKIVHKNNHLELEQGKSFAFVSGLGGRDIRKQKRDGDWWAAKYSKSQKASYGALFCTFAETTAECYFKTIKDKVPDTFTLESRVNSTAVE